MTPLEAKMTPMWPPLTWALLTWLDLTAAYDLCQLQTARCKIIDVKCFVRRPMVPENFDGDVTMDRLDSLGKPKSTLVFLLNLTRKSSFNAYLVHW